MVVSLCLLVINIMVIGFISKDIENCYWIFINGLFYIFGRIVIYMVFGFIFIFIFCEGVSMFMV